MKRTILSVFMAMSILASSPAGASAQDARQRTVLTVVQDALAQLPAQDVGSLDREMADIAANAPESVEILAGMLQPAAQGQNSVVEYALNGVVNYVGRPENGGSAASVKAGLVSGLEKCTDPANRVFLLSRLSLIATSGDIPVFVKYVSDENLAPVAAGIAAKTDISMAFMTAIVVGGAFFGDNLSFISDTTIAATRTQGCVMRDKFRVNFLIALPAALLVLIYYIVYGMQTEAHPDISPIEWVKIIPYLIVLGTSIAGMNVTLVLLLGLLSTGIIGWGYGTFDLFGWFGAMGEGVLGMGELIIITLMAGGMLELIRFNGGIDYILHRLTKRINNKRGAEFSIAALVSLANFCTANNTIAIITVGPLASRIAEEYRVDKRKSASILDTFSCVIQGIIPYGAQMLIAAGLTQLSPLDIIPYLYYPMALGIFAILSIAFRFPRRYS